MNNLYKLVLFILIAIVGYLFISKKRLNSSIESKDQIIKEKNDSIKTIKLDNGTLAFYKTRAESDLENLLQGYSWLEDSLKKLGVKNKDLKVALFIAQTTSGSGTGIIDTVRISENDTVYTVGRISINETFFQLSAILYPDNMYKYSYYIFDSLNIINTSHRKNIFSNYEHNVRVANANPKTIITGVTSLTIKEQPYRWAISATIGYGISNNGLSPYLGIGISKPLIKFR